MSLRDELVDRLENENEELRSRLRVLEEISGVRFETPPQFALTRNESAIFGMLLKNALVRRGSMMEVLYFHKQDEADIRIVDVWICKMRAKLKPWGIEIQTQWGQGYFLSAESKAVGRRLIDGFVAA